MFTFQKNFITLINDWFDAIKSIQLSIHYRPTVSIQACFGVVCSLHAHSSKFQAESTAFTWKTCSWTVQNNAKISGMSVLVLVLDSSRTNFKSLSLWSSPWKVLVLPILIQRVKTSPVSDEHSFNHLICLQAFRAEWLYSKIRNTPSLKKPYTPIMSHNFSKHRTVSMIFDTSNCPSKLDTLPSKLLIWHRVPAAAVAMTTKQTTTPMWSNNETMGLRIEEIILIEKNCNLLNVMAQLH